MKFKHFQIFGRKNFLFEITGKWKKQSPLGI